MNWRLNSCGKPKLADEPWKKSTSQVMWLISSIRRFHVSSRDSLIFSTCAGCLYIQNFLLLHVLRLRAVSKLELFLNFFLVLWTFWMFNFKDKLKLRSFVSDCLSASWYYFSDFSVLWSTCDWERYRGKATYKGIAGKIFAFLFRKKKIQ